jgi:amidase
MTEPPYKAIAARKRAEQQSRIPKAWLLPQLPPPTLLDVRSYPQSSGILTTKELSITGDHDATSLATLLRTRALTAEEVAIAFCKRAAIAQQLTKCLTEIFFEEGIARAKWLDAEIARTGRPVGPLHGVPISLKDTFKVRGYDTSIGLASLAGNPAKENSTLVDILLEAGAVLYCKTNIPQTLMALDSENHLFGRTLNPRNRAVTAGGSSGGEGALIAMRGSVLGVGTDVGGSIRIPAMCNGLYGIKPSAGRIPFSRQQGNSSPGSGGIGLRASAGPIATSMRDCELFLKVVADARPWERDPDVVYGLWEEQGRIEAKKPLIGVMRKDDLITPLPPVSKVLEEAVQALRKSGYEVVEMNTPAFQKCQSLANKFFGIDGGKYIFDIMEKGGEPLNTWLSTRLRRKTPTELEPLVALHARKTELETEMLKIWRDPKTGRRIDAMICPVAPHPVPPIDRWNGTSYTSSFVLLDYPAGTLPVRDLEASDLEGELEVKGEALNSWDKVNRELCKSF